MNPIRHLLVALLLLTGLFAAPTPARAAQSYDNCTAFIDTLPATISTQGTWCLRHDVTTPITSGNAVTINANNVTIDCNDFKIGGLQAGVGTSAIGIYANNRLNATVRHCGIRGFQFGLALIGNTGGHLVEDNRFDSNTYTGLDVEGDGSLIQRNRVIATGGSTSVTGVALGIYTFYSVDILDNSVDGVLPTAGTGGAANAWGIRTNSNLNGSLVGNRVRGVVSLSPGHDYGIENASSGRINLRRNDVDGAGNLGYVAIACANSLGSAEDNIMSGFAGGLITTFLLLPGIL